MVALDVTQPDPIDKLNVLNFAGQPDIAWVPDQSVGVVPECAGLGGAPGSGCGTLSYPALLWEFDDTCLATDTSGTSCSRPATRTATASADLGDSWSQVNTGRILVNVEGEDDPVVKFVAVFGGGLDPDDKIGVGNWIYMVDVETGKAIYKRAVASAVPSEPAAVDTDQDGLLDTLYVGTAGGLLYKVDISTPADVDPSTGRISDLRSGRPSPIFDTTDGGVRTDLLPADGDLRRQPGQVRPRPSAPATARTSSATSAADQRGPLLHHPRSRLPDPASECCRAVR